MIKINGPNKDLFIYKTNEENAIDFLIGIFVSSFALAWKKPNSYRLIDSLLKRLNSTFAT